jgi:tetratricopeptide (TPR) repeat protein
VKNPFSSRDLSETLRRRVELAIAVAQERLLSTHVDHALRLIQLISEQIRFENALGIYTRMLRLSDDEARVITTRAMAILGEQDVDPTAWQEHAPEREPDERSSPRRTFLRLMRQRLRGRVKDELRRWVELAAARTEIALFHTHVENASNFIELLEKEQPPAEAVELYLDALEVRESVAELTYYAALGRIADRQLPETKRGATVAAHPARPQRGVQLAEGS